MKTLMTTTALVVATAFPMAAPAIASEHAATTQMMPGSVQGTATADVLASDLIGMRVYASETDVETFAQDEAAGGWTDIGEVSDVVMSRDGEARSILLDVGGFLGIGEKTVAVNMNDLRYVADANDPGDYFIVFKADRAMLEDAEAFDFDTVGAWTEAAWADVKATTGSAATAVSDTTQDVAEGARTLASDTATAVSEGASDAADAVARTAETVEEGAKDAASTVADTAGAAADATGDAVARAGDAIENASTEAAASVESAAEEVTTAMVDDNGFELVKSDAITTEMLTGARVYDSNDKWIGEVSELIVRADGMIDKAVVDVGGFLGIGEKPVAQDIGELVIRRQPDSGEIRVFTAASKDELEAMPAYGGN